MKDTFERVEKKYLLDARQYEGLLRSLEGRLRPDAYSHGTVLSLYLDTDDNLLIRRSLQKPAYKEKVRLRSYGVPGSGDTVYLELKKKCRGVVYKRRVALSAQEAMDYLCRGKTPGAGGQIFSEVDYAVRRYGLRPALVLCYDRAAYAEAAPTPDALRLTLDAGIRSRRNGLDLRLGDEGEALLPPGMRLMEIKTARAVPLWLCHALSRYEIRPVSFSKYGQVYARELSQAAPSRILRPERSPMVCSQPCLIFPGS